MFLAGVIRHTWRAIMAKDDLREFFREKKSKAGPGDTDWPAKRDTWIQSVDDLYDVITKQYLAGPINDGSVTVSYEEKQVTEDYVGQYTIRVLVLQVGEEKVIFSPKGVNVVGASGRIDLRGDTGEVTVVRQPKERWAVVATRTPTLKLVPLNEESLLDALRNVMRT